MSVADSISRGIKHLPIISAVVVVLVIIAAVPAKAKPVSARTQLVDAVGHPSDSGQMTSTTAALLGLGGLLLVLLIGAAVLTVTRRRRTVTE